jgi:heme/copper-type cytochrome/quinol oxidase subunit 1
MAMRLELSQAGDAFLQGNYQLYNVLVTSHAFLMIFFFRNANGYWWFWKLICSNFNWSL